MALLHHRFWNHRHIYLGSLALIALSMPVSPFGISVGTFLLAGNWLAEGNLKRKGQILKQRPSLLLFISIFLLCLLGLFHTSNMKFGWHDVVMKLPLFVLPLVVGTSPPVTLKELRIILIALLAGLWSASLTGMAVLLGWTDIQINNIREISVFISHIRLSLITGVILQIVLYMLIREKDLHKAEKIFYLLSLLWLPFFLFILKSLTGFIMLGLLFLTAFLFLLQSIRAFMLRWFVILTGITAVLLVGAWLSAATTRYHTRDPLPDTTKIGTTANKNPYDPPKNLAEVENGHYVWLYVCEQELRPAWNRSSDLDYDGRDRAGQRLSTTLIRYMTSRDLRKDSLGFSRMTPEDIRNVENGMTNHIFTNRLALYPYFYILMWEKEHYCRGEVSGHSHTQRLAYIRTAWQIARDHLWWGVGTGDVPDTYKEYYRKMNTGLTKRWQLRAHNQYLTYWITYGIFGFLWFLIAFFGPFFLGKKQKEFFALIFMIIAALSMLYEDTLETQAGVYFIVFFYSLFIFGMKNNGNKILSTGKNEYE